MRKYYYSSIFSQTFLFSYLWILLYSHLQLLVPHLAITDLSDKILDFTFTHLPAIPANVITAYWIITSRPDQQSESFVLRSTPYLTNLIGSLRWKPLSDWSEWADGVQDSKVVYACLLEIDQYDCHILHLSSHRLHHSPPVPCHTAGGSSALSNLVIEGSFLCTLCRYCLPFNRAVWPRTTEVIITWSHEIEEDAIITTSMILILPILFSFLES